MSKTLELNTLDGRKIEVTICNFKSIEIIRDWFPFRFMLEANDMQFLDITYKLFLSTAQSWVGTKEAFSREALKDLLDSDLSLVLQANSQINTIMRQRISNMPETANPVETLLSMTHKKPEDGVVH